MIDFKTRKTRINLIISVVYYVAANIFNEFYGYHLYNLYNFVKSHKSNFPDFYYENHKVYKGWTSDEVLFILITPLLIYWIVMPLYRSIKRWVSRGQ